MSDFKKLKTFKYSEKVKEKEKEKVPLFTVGLRYQKSDMIDEYLLHCPCEKRSNVPGFKGIDGHCNRPTHKNFVYGLTKSFMELGIDFLITIMTDKEFWKHEFTVNTKKAIYITFRVRKDPEMPILATITITPIDRTFEFDYNGAVPYEVIAKMEENCLLLEKEKRVSGINEVFLSGCLARNVLLHWCCGAGMTGTTPQVTTTSNSTTSASMRNAWQEEHQEVPQEEVPQEVPREVPQEVPREVPHEVPQEEP